MSLGALLCSYKLCLFTLFYPGLLICSVRDRAQLLAAGNTLEVLSSSGSDLNFLGNILVPSELCMKQGSFKVNTYPISSAVFLGKGEEYREV